MTPSPFEKHHFLGHTFYLKRDDLLDPHFSGNKARKFYPFLTRDLPHIERIVSYGSNQSNAMYALSVLAQIKNWEFIYWCDHIPSYLKAHPVGNYKYALQNGMKIMQSIQKREEALAYVDAKTLFVEEGGRQESSQEGIALLAEELLKDIEREGIERPYLFLPSGTGTTALYLQQNLPFPVYTTPCVGGADYLQSQFEALAKKDFPTILLPHKRYHYGKLYIELYVLWQKLHDEMGVEFDLLYDPVGWSVLLEHIKHVEGTPIYIHQGGLLGNVSMLKRYQYKYAIIKP